MSGRSTRLSETEKITINLGPVDLGRIELLVEQGLYTNRTDLIRTAIRNQLDRHEPVVQEAVVKQSASLGVLILGRKELEAQKTSGKRMKLFLLGMLVLTNDITPELALDVIDSITVYGVFRAPAAVREALGDRIRR